MKRLLRILILSAIVLTPSCSPLQKEMDYYNQIVEALDDELFSVQTSIATYYSLLEHLKENDFIVEVIPLKDGTTTVGYYLTFSKGEKLTLYFGKDGEKGDRGNDGADGANGYTPVLKLVKGNDGNSFWTVNGVPLSDEYGNRITANGQDGASPILRLDGMIWMISYDNGANWTPLGSSVLVSVSIFKYVEMTDGGKVNVYLQDGEMISIPVYKTMELTIEKPSAFTAGTPQNIKYQINGKADDGSEIELSYSITQGWKAEIKRDSRLNGYLKVTPPNSSGAKGDLIFFCSSEGYTVSKYQSLIVR